MNDNTHYGASAPEDEPNDMVSHMNPYRLVSYFDSPEAEEDLERLQRDGSGYEIYGRKSESEASCQRDVDLYLGTSATRYQPKTIQDYIGRIKRLYADARRHLTGGHELIEEPSPLQVAAYLLWWARHPTMPPTPSMWRIHRCAALAHFAGNRLKSENYQKAYDLLSGAPSNLIPDTVKGRIASELARKMDPKSARRRGIPESDIDLLLVALRGTNTPRQRVGTYVANWIEATLATGVRPIEWELATWSNKEQGELKVKTAKRKKTAAADHLIAKARRAGKKVRTVHDLNDEQVLKDAVPEEKLWRIVTVADDHIGVVDSHLCTIEACVDSSFEGGRTLEASFKAFYDRCRNRLRDVCREEFGRKTRYTLRMARAQFIANDKLDSAISEVAERVGHASTRTTKRAYPSARKAWSGGHHRTYKHLATVVKARPASAAPGSSPNAGDTEATFDSNVETLELEHGAQTNRERQR